MVSISKKPIQDCIDITEVINDICIELKSIARVKKQLIELNGSVDNRGLNSQLDIHSSNLNGIVATLNALDINCSVNIDNNHAIIIVGHTKKDFSF